MTLNLLATAEKTLTALQPILRSLTVEDKVRQTPCAEYDCHALAEHLMEGLVGLGKMAGTDVRIPETGSLEEKVTTVAEQALAAWSDVDLDGAVPFGGGELPARVGATIFSLELLLHGWDFAQATGQKVDIDDEVVSHIAEIGRPIIDGGRDRGAFAEAHTAAEDASELDRLAAYSGRTPIR